MWKCSSIYFLKNLDADRVYKEPHEDHDQGVFQKVLKGKGTIIMIVFNLNYFF